MSGVKIPCPKCSAVLKLKDRSLLGKTGKCPKCGHKFLLEDPEPVAVELVEDEPEPVPGENPTWIPDTPAEPAAAKSAGGEGLPDFLQSSGEKKAEQEANPLSFLESNASAPAESASPLAGIGGNDVKTSSSPVPRRKRKKRRKSGVGSYLVILLVIGLLGGGGYYAIQQMQQDQATSVAENNAPPVEPVPVAPDENPNRDLAAPPAVSKRSENPIQLFHLPAGVRVVVNLHPAVLWENERQYQEFRGALGPLGTWLETKLKEVTRQNPQDIEELLVGIILGPRGTEPEVAGVVHLKEAQPRAELLKTYEGQPYNEFSTDVLISNETAFRLIDDQTIAITPAKYIEDVLAFEQTPALTSNEILEVLEGTDRTQHLTVVFDPFDIEQHQNTLFPASAKMVSEKVLRWLGEQSSTVGWSLNVGENFESELVVLSDRESRPRELSQQYKQRIDVLPELLLTAVQKMNPQRSGYRKIIGRFPAMLKVLTMTTSVAVDQNLIRATTSLPAKAAPNLALGTLLTWDESTRTDFSAGMMVERKPKKVDVASLPFEERLKVKMEIDYRGTPLDEALAYMADEAKIPIVFDAEAFELAGLTQNMRQTYAIESANVLEALHEIVKRYADEPNPIVFQLMPDKNQIVMTTIKGAEKSGVDYYRYE